MNGLHSFFAISSQVLLVERIIWFYQRFCGSFSKKNYDWMMQSSLFFGCLSWWNLLRLRRFPGISPGFPWPKTSILPSRGPFIKARSSMASARRISNSKNLGIFFWVRNLVMKIPGKLGGGFKDFIHFHPESLGKWADPMWRAYFSTTHWEKNHPQSFDIENGVFQVRDLLFLERWSSICRLDMLNFRCVCCSESRWRSPLPKGDDL